MENFEDMPDLPFLTESEKKMLICRFMLEPPAPNVVLQCLRAINGLRKSERFLLLRDSRIPDQCPDEEDG